MNKAASRQKPGKSRLYAVRNRAGRLLVAWTDSFLEADRELAEKVIQVPVETASLYVEPDDSRLSRALSGAVEAGECAWMFYPAKRDDVRTVFFMEDGDLFVRKDVLHRAFRPFSFGRFVQLEVPPLPVFKGERVSDRVCRLVSALDYDGVVRELSAFIQRLMAAYPPIASGILPETTFDAIPQNCIIDAAGQYNFFDLEYSMFGGVPLAYLVSRAVLTTVYRHVRDAKIAYDCARTLNDLAGAFGVEVDIANTLRINRMHKRFTSYGPMRILTNVMLAFLPVRDWRMRLCWWSVEPFRKDAPHAA